MLKFIVVVLIFFCVDFLYGLCVVDDAVLKCISVVSNRFILY